MIRDGYTLPVTLPDHQYIKLMREASDKGITVNDLIKAIVRVYNAQNELPTIKGITLPELVVMMQAGEIEG